jgi:hypothetical protein
VLGEEKNISDEWICQEYDQLQDNLEYRGCHCHMLQIRASVFPEKKSWVLFLY